MSCAQRPPGAESGCAAVERPCCSSLSASGPDQTRPPRSHRHLQPRCALRSGVVGDGVERSCAREGVGVTQAIPGVVHDCAASGDLIRSEPSAHDHGGIRRAGGPHRGRGCNEVRVRRVTATDDGRGARRGTGRSGADSWTGATETTGVPAPMTPSKVSSGVMSLSYGRSSCATPFHTAGVCGTPCSSSHRLRLRSPATSSVGRGSTSRSSSLIRAPMRWPPSSPVTGTAAAVRTVIAE